MRLLRIRQRIFNMDLVTDIVIAKEPATRVTLFFAAPQAQATAHSSTAREIRLSGADAVLMLRWIDANSENAAPETP